MTGDTEYLRADDIARLTGMSVRTIRRWIAGEILPSTKLAGARLVPKAELKRVLSPLSTTTEEDTNDGGK